jgi:MFS family permease
MIQAFMSGMPIYGFALSAAVVKIAAGIASDRLDKRKILAAATLSMLAALVVLCLFSTFGGLIAASCLAGASLGGTLPSAGALIADRFGAARFGATMGLTYVIDAIVTIAASRVSGMSFDRTGSYHPAFLIYLGFCTAIAIAAIAFEYKKRGPSLGLSRRA